MSRYHIHLIYAVSFAVTGTKQYTGSEANVQLVTKPKRGIMNYNMQEKHRTMKSTLRKRPYKRGRSKHIE